MEIPTQSVNVTELDFDQIKTNLIEYFKAGDSPFKDWDYNGSGLNMLLDVLAHNTHYNALLAHMAVNESFIDTAQLRQNVVSAAKLIGYRPRSYSSSKAIATITATPRNSSLNEYVFPAGSTFSSNITDFSKNQTYKFTNLNDIVCKRVGGELVASDVELRQGTLVTKRIQINSTQSNNEYIIDDKNIDTRTLKVAVYQTGRSEINEVYSLFTDINIVDKTTPIYFLYENYNGNYVLSFGNGVFGKKPDNLNVLELTYLVADGAAANGSNVFSYSGFFDSTQLTRVQINTVASAVGGSDRESISSIKYNAPLQYISQNRAVTADDYKTLVYSYMSDIKSVAVWGGEENDPPQYGKVFLSAKKEDSTDDFLTTTEKQNLLSYLGDKKVLSIFPEIVDPEYINIVLDVLFKYNRNLTTYTKTQLETKVRESVTTFNTQYLESFDGVFRHSFLTKTVDGTSPAILNSLIRVFVSKSFTLKSADPKKITLKYGTTLTTDDSVAIVNSTGWIYDGITYYIGEEAHPTLPDIRLLYVYYYDSDNKPIIRNKGVGTLTLSTGVMEIEPLLTTTDTTITIDTIPLSNDLAPKRNQLIRIDTSRLNVYGEVDLIAVGGSNRSIEYKTFSRDR